MADEILLAGLGRVGASLALALRNPKIQVRLAGYDPEKRVAREALKAQVVDRTLNSLREAPPECDLCILSLDPEAMIPALETLSNVLPEGALILGTSPVQSHILAWVTEHMPPGRRYIGIVPVEGASAIEPAGLYDDTPRADRFAGGVMALVLPPGTPQASIDVALSLASIAGAKPFFMDASELDAATAANNTLPALLAAALMATSIRQPGWRDARRLTGATFAHATALIDAQIPGMTPATLLLQRTSLLDRLDALQIELSEWRSALASDTEDALKHHLDAATRSHDAWLAARRKGDWGVEEMSPSPPLHGPSALERMFGLSPRRRKPDSD